MSDTEKLKQAIVDMTISPVKADREAIARLQKSSDLSFCNLVDHLEYLSLQEQIQSKSIPTRPKNNLWACGVCGAAFAGLTVLPFNSRELPKAIVLGATAAVSCEMIQRR